MAISKREMELSNSLVALQRQYNELYGYKEVWMRVAKERLIKIDRLQEDILSLANAIKESEVNDCPASIPLGLLSNETVSILQFIG